MCLVNTCKTADRLDMEYYQFLTLEKSTKVKLRVEREILK